MSVVEPCSDILPPVNVIKTHIEWDISEENVAIPTKTQVNKKRTTVILSLLLITATLAIIGVVLWYLLVEKPKIDSPKFGVQYVGRLIIANRDFDYNYADKASDVFLKETTDIGKTIKEAFTSSGIKSYYNKSKVFTFGKGSLMSYFWLDLRVTSEEREKLTEDLVKSSLNKNFQTPGTPDYQIQPESTTITKLSAKDMNTLAKATECHTYRFIGSDRSITLEGPDSKSSSCFWHLQGPAGLLIKLRLEWVQKGCRDRIAVYNEVTAIGRTLLTSLYKCSWKEPVVEVFSSANVMAIIWKQGRYSYYDPFILSAQALPMLDCSANITLTGGWDIQGNASTPYFPSYYPPNTYCTWHFTVPSLDYGIALWFDGYELDTPTFTEPCSQGQWIIQNRKFCGKRVLQPYAQRIYAVALSTTVTFNSEVILTGPGIQFYYSLFNQSDPCPKDVLCSVSGLCVPECDGLKDCTNGADEKNCVCPAQFQCTEGTTCLSFHKVCNQEEDCKAGNDEDNCDEAVPCNQFTYTCDDGSCVKKANPQCDYASDCQDGTDEKNCECGLQTSMNRIVGGTNSTEGEWPWQASLQVRSSHVCGGMLINKHWVLSAAHCFTSSYASPDEWTVYLGKFKLNVVSNNELTFKVLKIVSHPYYNENNNDYDIALLQLDLPVPIVPSSYPVCLPAKSHVFETDRMCWVTGWGKTKEDGSIANVLQKVDVKLVDQSTCNKAYSYSITPRMLCAGYTEGKKDSCQGDSGGPLVCEEDSGRWFLAGIVSYGMGCARPGFYGVYTRVTRLIDWIHTIAS